MEFQNYINGKWVKGRSTFQTINPANEELVAEIAQAEICGCRCRGQRCNGSLQILEAGPCPIPR